MSDAAPTLALSADTTREILAALAEISDEGGRDYADLFRKVAEGQTLLEALDLPPATVDILYAQAFARFEARRLTEALHLFQTLTLLAPKVKDHWLGLGICLRVVEQDQAAQIAFDTAASLAPRCPAVLFHRIELACHQQDWAGASRLIARFEGLEDSVERQRMAPEVQRLATLVRSRV